MKIAALILGILGLLISFSIFVDLGLILSVLGLVLGLIALKNADSKTMCIIAIILSVLGLVSCFSDGSSSTGTTTDTTSTSNVSSESVETLGIGDTWTVDRTMEFNYNFTNFNYL